MADYGQWQTIAASDGAGPRRRPGKANCSVMFANKLAFPQTPARPADNANMTSIIKIAASRIAWTNRGASRHSLMAPSSRPEVAA
jgi:hypothetical protein